MKVFIILFLFAALGFAQNVTLSASGSIRKQFIQDAIGISRGYSQGVVVDYLKSDIRRVYLAGQTFVADGTLESQLRAIWVGIERILKAANGDLSDLVTMTSSIKDLTSEKTTLFTTIRREVLGGSDPDHAKYPASMLLGASLAQPFLLAEMQCQAEYKIPKDWKIKPLQ